MEGKYRQSYAEQVNKAINDGILEIVSLHDSNADDIVYEYDAHLLVSNYWFFKDIIDDEYLPIKCVKGEDILNGSIFEMQNMDKYNHQEDFKDIIKGDALYCIVNTLDEKTIDFVKVHMDRYYLYDMPNLPKYIGLSACGVIKYFNPSEVIDYEHTADLWIDYEKANNHFIDLINYISKGYKYYCDYTTEIGRNCDFEMMLICNKKLASDANTKANIIYAHNMFINILRVYDNAINKFYNAYRYIDQSAENMYDVLDDALHRIFSNELENKLVEVSLCNDDGSYKKYNITNCEECNICDKIIEAYENILNS